MYKRQVLTSVKERFVQFEKYSGIFGFLFTPTNLKEIKDEDPMLWTWKRTRCRLNWTRAKDIMASELFTEIKVFSEMIPQNIKTPIEIMKHLNRIGNPFPNVYIAYRILLSVPVTVASAERSFSRLKLIKTCLLYTSRCV